MKNKIHSIYYHNPDSRGFEKIIKFYKRHNFNFISLDVLFNILQNGASISEKNVFISFDDGWKGNLDLIPIIERYQVPVCIFVSLDPIQNGNFWWEYVSNEVGLEKMLEFKKLPFNEFTRQLDGFRQRNILNRSAMTFEELNKLSEHPLVTIQSHTLNHPILTSVPDNILEKELRESQKQIEEISGKTVYSFSYPNGNVGEREVEVCRQYYKLAFTTEQKHISTDDDIFLLPRIALTGNYIRDLLKISGIWPFLRKVGKSFTFVR